jgi:hypothetical protein
MVASVSARHARGISPPSNNLRPRRDFPPQVCRVYLTRNDYKIFFSKSIPPIQPEVTFIPFRIIPGGIPCLGQSLVADSLRCDKILKIKYPSTAISRKLLNSI